MIKTKPFTTEERERMRSELTPVLCGRSRMFLEDGQFTAEGLQVADAWLALLDQIDELERDAALSDRATTYTAKQCVRLQAKLDRVRETAAGWLADGDTEDQCCGERILAILDETEPLAISTDGT